MPYIFKQRWNWPVADIFKQGGVRDLVNIINRFGLRGLLSKVVNGLNVLGLMSWSCEGDVIVASASHLPCNRHMIRPKE